MHLFSHRKRVALQMGGNRYAELGLVIRRFFDGLRTTVVLEPRGAKGPDLQSIHGSMMVGEIKMGSEVARNLRKIPPSSSVDCWTRSRQSPCGILFHTLAFSIRCYVLSRFRIFRKLQPGSRWNKTQSSFGLSKRHCLGFMFSTSLSPSC